MALYLISYDINEKDAFEYGPLWARLREIGAVKILYSEWVITGNTGRATAIYNEVAKRIQAKDRLLVQEITRDAQWDKLLMTDADFEKLLGNARG